LIDRSARAKRQKVRTTFAPAKSSVFINPHVPCCERNLEEVSFASATGKSANDGALAHDQLSDRASV
jgi:hypothetical protein